MTIHHQLKTLWLKIITLYKTSWNLKAWNLNVYIHTLKFEWKHSNLRLRLYLLWIKVLGKYKMIAKMLWPLIQVNLPLMSFINEIPILSQKYKKKALWLFYRDVTVFHQIPLTSVVFRHKTLRKTLRHTNPLCVT